MIEQIKRDKGTNGFDTISNSGYCHTGNCTLNIQSDGTYSTAPSTTATKFTRVVDIDEIKAGIEYRVIVYVTWKSGSISNQYKLESYIYNVTL
jgi:cytidylate kinase